MAFLIGCTPAVCVLANGEHYFAFNGNLKDAELFALLAGGALCALIAGSIVATIYPENGRAADKVIYTFLFGVGFAVLDGCIACVGCALDVVSSLKK